jgi:flavodoxin
MMKSLIVYASGHHGNTEKIATVFADTLNAEKKNLVVSTAGVHNSYFLTFILGRPHDRWNVTKLEQIDAAALDEYDLVGFGSGAYYFQLHPALFQFIERFPMVENKKAFVFTTSGLTSKFLVRFYHEPLKNILAAKGFDVIGEFNAGGFDTFGAAQIIGFGGLKKGRPNAADLSKARTFANHLKEKAGA